MHAEKKNEYDEYFGNGEFNTKHHYYHSAVCAVLHRVDGTQDIS